MKRGEHGLFEVSQTVGTGKPGVAAVGAGRSRTHSPGRTVFAVVHSSGGFDVDLIGVVAESDLAYRIVGYGWGKSQGAFVFLPWRGEGATLLLRRRSASPADEIELARLAATPKYEFLEGDRFRALLERGLIDDEGYATPLGEDAFGTGP